MAASMINITISRTENSLIREMAKERCAAYKKWIATAVESENFEKATALVAELRAHESLIRIFTEKKQ